MGVHGRFRASKGPSGASIAENLHRAELTVQERAEHVAEWVRLTEKVSPQVGAKPQGGRPEGGIRRAARELPVPGETEKAREQAVSRAVKRITTGRTTPRRRRV